MIKNTKNFNASELSASDTAKKNKICNTIPEEYHKNANDLLELLQQLRDAWGSPLKITSGYRCSELNRLVKGQPTSAHTQALAADLQPSKGTPEELYQFIRGWLVGSKHPFQECFLERSGKTTWVHFAIKGINGQQLKKMGELYK